MTNKIGKKRKITFWTRLGFGMGGMLNSGALTFTHSYMVLFLSTECGLSAGEAALISSFAIYVNAILCPLMGFVADNFYATKIGRIFGRRRFWILLAIPMMIAEPLIFVATPFGFPYYFVLYLIYNVAYTFCTANLSPLTIEMTDDFKECTYLTGYKHLFGNAAGFLMAALVGFGFGTFGETNPFSYFIIATINASVMAISLLCVYLSTWEHTPEEVAQEKIESVGEGIKKFFIDVISTFRNKSFRKVLYAQVSTKLAAACWSACLSFFIVYCLQIPKSYESVMEMPGKVVAIAMIAYPIIFAIWKFFYVGFQYLPDVLLNYIPDVDELITLRRREGIYSSAQQLCQQIAQAIAVNVWAIVLAASGFIQTAGNSDAVTQPATVPLYICGYMIIGCAGFFLLAAVLARGIKIDKEQCDVLCDEIHRVKEGGKMADVKPEVKALCEELSGFKYEDCFAHNNVGFQDGSVTPAE